MTDERRPANEAQEPGESLAAPRPHISRGSGASAGMPEGQRAGMTNLFERMRRVVDAARQTTDEQLEMAEQAAAEMRERAEHAAETARPEFERLAAEAKAVADAARPHIDHYAAEAAAFAREHQDDLKAATVRALRIAARLTVPQRVRDAVEEELNRDHPNDASPKHEE